CPPLRPAIEAAALSAATAPAEASHPTRTRRNGPPVTGTPPSCPGPKDRPSSEGLAVIAASSSPLRAESDVEAISELFSRGSGKLIATGHCLSLLFNLLAACWAVCGSCDGVSPGMSTAFVRSSVLARGQKI